MLLWKSLPPVPLELLLLEDMMRDGSGVGGVLVVDGMLQLGYVHEHEHDKNGLTLTPDFSTFEYVKDV